MTRDIMATIKLAQGRVGFYDELSRIHLTLGAPTAYVYSGTNCARLRRAVRDGVIRLVDGTLGNPVPPLKIVKVNGKLKLASNLEAEMKPVFKEAKAEVEEAKVEAPAEEVKEEAPVEAKKEAPVKEEAPAVEEAPAAEEVKEEVAAEEVKEEAQEEAVKEEKPKKTRAKKAAAKK